MTNQRPGEPFFRGHEEVEERVVELGVAELGQLGGVMVRRSQTRPQRRTKTSTVTGDSSDTLLYQHRTSGSSRIVNLGGEPGLSFLSIGVYEARTDLNCVGGGRAQIRTGDLLRVRETS